MDYTVIKNEFSISTDKTKIDVDYVHQFLTQSYWSPGVPIETVKKAMDGSLCFGMYDNNSQTLPNGRQVGYARMITDNATFGYLADVFIDEKFRGKGLGKWLIKVILAHPDLQGLRRIMLATKDAHKLYEQCDFTSLNNPERYMVYTPDINKNK
ncbi:MAG TPA: GNAT family N-acetyltransferase [Chitinophagaceae bacterium]|nr:GNAT family N-acetyltransferase [Chitinophagaceae bacterium]